MKILLERWILTGCVGCAGFVLIFPALSSLPDGGYSLGRVEGWTLWTLISGLPWALGWIEMSRTYAIGSGVLLVTAAILSLIRRKESTSGSDPVKFVLSHYRRLLVCEGVHLAAFLLMAFTISHYGAIEPRSMERFQDFAFEQAIARDSTWPATDPWFAGAGPTGEIPIRGVRS